LREHKLGVGGGEQLNKVQTEANFWVDFVEESCELLAVALNQYEMNKLEGNQKSGKSIFDIKFNESGKPENDGLVEVEVPKVKPSSKSN
jgi:hypothetical protein